MNYLHKFIIILILLLQSLTAQDTTANLDTNLLTTQEKEFIKKHPIIRFRVRPDLPPFEFSQKGIASGIAIDYIKKSAKNIGLNIEFILNNDPLDVAHKTIQNENGVYDTILFAVKSKERAEKFSFGIKYLSYPMMIISHNNGPNITSLKDLENKTIVLEQGFLTNQWVKKDYPAINIINAFNTKEALQMVNDGKAIAYIGNLGVMTYMKIFNGMNNLKVSARSGYGDISYSFIAPKKWPELSSLLSKGFKQISSVEHSFIQQKWFSIQTIEKTDFSLLWKIALGLISIILWVLWWNRKISLEKDKTNKVLTKLKQKEKDLESSNSRLTLALESVNIGVWDWDMESDIIIWDDKMFEMYGLEKINPIPYDVCLSTILEEDCDNVEVLVKQFINSKSKNSMVFRIMKPDKSIRYIESSSDIICDDSGKAIRVIGIDIDITERKVLEERIQKELESKNTLLRVKEEFNSFFQLSINLQLIATTEGILKELNSAWKSILGYENEELIGKVILDLIHPDDIEPTILEMTKLAQGENVYFFENRYIHKDGHYVNLAWSATTDSSNNLIYATAQDLTSFKEIEIEQKEKEKILFQQSKMAAMGEMLGNIAHQWRQPLSVISTSASGAKAQNELGLLTETNLNSYFDTINHTAQYLSDTIDDFRGFFNPNNNKKVKLNISDTVMKTLNLLNTSFSVNNIEIVKDIESYTLSSQENEIIQALINILNNAKDALLIKEDRRLLFINTYQEEGISYIEILDNAGGIKEDIIDRIFEPYFTTKHQSQGTGIGLYMSEEIIKNHLNGSVIVSNSTYVYDDIEYIGAKFIIKLA